MDTDYPAAHSMDTTWFAVDGIGQVAFFESGEAGAVPVQGHEDQTYQVAQGIVQLFPRIEALEDLTGRLRPNDPAGREHWTVAHSNPRVALFFLKSVSAVQKELSSGQAKELPSTSSPAVVVRNLSRALIEKLHDQGQCLACFPHHDWQDEEGTIAATAHHGAFFYEHLTNNWICGPYGRRRVPAKPLHVDNLPPALRNIGLQVRFPAVNFAAAPHVQPVSHTQCIVWDPYYAAYLDINGRCVHPIPGNEENYEEMVQDFRQDMPHLEFEPLRRRREEDTEPK